MRCRGKNTLIGGALILSVGGILSKIIGAFYRIPLTNILGSEGMGLYQLVFPYYIFLLTVSTTSLPAAVSGLIGGSLKRGRPDLAEKTFRVALFSLTVIGAALSLMMYFGAPLLAGFLKAPELAGAFRAISPAILFVCVISAFRGKFSGRKDMTPTAVSQVVEQLFKALFCLYFARRFMPDVGRAVLFSVLSVTISEGAALLYLAFRSAFSGGGSVFQPLYASKGESAGEVFRAIYAISIPVTLSALLTPLSQIADGFLVMHIVGRYASGAGQYGLFSGPVCSLVSFPTVFAQSIGLALIPGIAGKSDAQREIATSLKLTFFVAFPCTLFLILFSGPVVGLLYRGLSPAELAETAALLKVYALSVVGLSLMQTSVSVLIAKNRAKVCAYFMVIAVTVKITLSAVLMSFPQVSIFGAAISGTVCFLLAGTLDLVYIIRDGQIGFSFSWDILAKPLFYSGAVAAIWFVVRLLPFGNFWRLAVAGILALAVYGLLFFKSSLFEEERNTLFGRKHDSNHRTRQ